MKPRRDQKRFQFASELAAEVERKKSAAVPDLFCPKSGSLDHALHDPVHCGVLVLHMTCDAANELAISFGPIQFSGQKFIEKSRVIRGTKGVDHIPQA